LFAILVGSLAIFFPLGIYCLLIARLNRRPHAVLVAGSMDFAGLLLAVSGLLFFIGPGLLMGFNYNSRDLWLQIHFRSLRGSRDHWWFIWVFLWYFYFAFIICWSSFLLWTRRRVTSVYNVAPAMFVQTIGQVLDRLGLDWARANNQIYIGYRRFLNPGSASGGEAMLAAHAASHVGGAADWPAGPTELDDSSPTADVPRLMRKYHILLELDPFPAMHHVAMTWPAETGPVRKEIETELSKSLALLPPPENRLGNLLTWIAAIIFVGLFALTVFIQHMLIKAAQL
jgi:hypothetical protein